jgi:hypothetical protein
MRILAIADVVSPVIYSENFPGNLPPFDLILSAGDMPGHVLEFIATKQVLPPVFVVGNHALGYVSDPLGGEPQLPGGCINAHGRIVNAGGLLIAGFEGSGRYRPGPHQYSELEYELMLARMTPKLAWNRLKYGRAVDILLTHAAPVGPHAGSDLPHRGIPAFNRFIEKWQPRLHVHGHVHLVGANAAREYTTDSGVRVVNAFDFTIIEL